MDPIVHVVTDADADLEQNQPSDAESIQTHVSVTSIKYMCAVSNVYSYSVGLHHGQYYTNHGLHRYLLKKSDHNDKLLSTPKPRLAFVGFANLLVTVGFIYALESRKLLLSVEYVCLCIKA